MMNDFESSSSLTDQNKSELVSIITPAFNSSSFIERAMSSAQEQTYPHWEMLIVIDKGNEDNTPHLVLNQAKKDSRIRLLQVPEEQGRGLALSRNYAISQAQGRYLAFLDSDDFWLNHKLKRQIEFMKTFGYALTCTAFRRIDTVGRRLGHLIKVPREINYKRLLQQNCIGCLTVILDTTQTGKPHFIEEKNEDFILWLQLLKRGFICYGLNEDLARYRIVPQSRSANKLESVKNIWHIYRDIEQLNMIYSAWCLSQFAWRNMIKHSRF